MASDLLPIGEFSPGTERPAFSAAELAAACQRPRDPVHIVRDDAGQVGVAFGGQPDAQARRNGAPSLRWMASLPALYPEWLGERAFCEAHDLRFPYVTGAMANGIATTRLVIAMSRAGMLSFFGAAGLGRERVSAAIDELTRELGNNSSWGVNLIHSPQEPDLENAVADMLVERDVRRVEASAFMALTPSVVRYAAAGLHQSADGRVHRARYVMAKISRPEVARPFMAPAPKAMLDALVSAGKLTQEEARLAQRVPVAADITVESDSGGHTDNRPLGAVLPVILGLAREMEAQHGYDVPIRIGAAGGIGTPQSVAAAFAMGASYVVTGSVNQAAVESGLSEAGRVMLAQAGLADVVMAPAADMFEMGVEVQVLRRGSMFGPRALKLHEIYVRYPGLDALPADVRARLEKEVLGLSVDEVWAETRSFWSKRDAREVQKAEADPKHKMALCFRWYLGLSSRWAITGEATRKLDYQIWCGPAMGAFNEWVKRSFLEAPEARTAVQIAYNLLEGAAAITRAQQLRSYGVPVPPSAFQFSARPLG